MGDENQFLRYAVPGIAVGLIFLLALCASAPAQTLAWLRMCNAPGGSTSLLNLVGLLLTGFLASGGLGFILAQVYFALPSWFNTADHRAVVGMQVPADKKPHPLDHNRSRLEAHRRTRLAWAISAGERPKEVEMLTTLCARRMAAVGTTLVGNVLAGVLWLVVLSARALGRPPAVGWFCGGLVILVPGMLLWRTWHKIRKDLEGIVKAGLGRRG